jgi:hypothetical protein
MVWSGVGDDDNRRIGGRVNDQVKCTNQQRSAVEIIDESSGSVEHGNRYTHSNTVIRNGKDLPSFREE